jgi:hypothetical protein
MPAKHILYNVEARSAVMRGVDQLAEAVKRACSSIVATFLPTL